MSLEFHGGIGGFLIFPNTYLSHNQIPIYLDITIQIEEKKNEMIPANSSAGSSSGPDSSLSKARLMYCWKCSLDCDMW